MHKVGHLLTFPCGGVGAYSRWKLIRGSALNRMDTVSCISKTAKYTKLAVSMSRLLSLLNSLSILHLYRQ